MGIKAFSMWNTRPQGTVQQIEPYRKYFFICEGANTERWYFQKLIARRRELHIHSLIDICFLEKTEQDKDITYPRQLVDFAERQKTGKDISFDPNRDKMVVIFDADIFANGKVLEYGELVKYAEEHGDILGVTNPSFELFLMLHYEDALTETILPNESDILKNEKEGRRTPIYRILQEKTNKNCKKNSAIGDLAELVEIAIEQEKQINQDIHVCLDQLTSNIGAIIDTIRKDVPVIA